MIDFKVAEVPLSSLDWSGMRARGVMRCPYCNASDVSLMFGLGADGYGFECADCRVSGHVESKSYHADGSQAIHVLLVLRAARDD
jgi:hypothetical protein